MAELGTKTDAETESLPVRQRSNSDPKPSVESRSSQSTDQDGPVGDSNHFLILGSSTTPRPIKHQKHDGRRNGENKNALGAGTGDGTPPAERKSKLSALGKIFRPWKWKRKKKSEKIEKAAVEIERKISMRTSREELIRKGVLKDPDGTQNHQPKIEMLKECDEEQHQENSDQITNNAIAMPTCDEGSTSHSLVNGEDPATPSSMSLPHHPRLTDPAPTASAGTLPVQPVATLTSASTPTVQGNNLHSSVAPSSPCVQLPSVSSSAHARPVIVSAGCPSPSLREPHPPPPNYNEAVGGNSVPYSFQPHLAGEGKKRVAIVAPQEIHADGSSQRGEEEDDDDEATSAAHLNKYVTDPSLVPTQSPYEAVLASEPDLSRLPQKSALKKSAQATPTPATSWSTRPLDTSRASPIPPHHTPRFGSDTPPPSSGQPSPQPAASSPPVGTVKPIPRPRVSVQNVVAPPTPVEAESDKENVQSQGEISSDDSEDEEIKYKDDFEPSSLAAKVARNDSLARFLESRPSKVELLAKNIIPSQSDTEKKDIRTAIGSTLIRRLSLRPSQEELENRNILHQQSSDEHLAEKERKRRYLIRKLSFRPSIEELRERKIIDFSDYVEVTDAHEYDRRAEKPWTKLTPRDKAAIRKELNEFKSKEMDVHSDSRHLTRFHKP